MMHDCDRQEVDAICKRMGLAGYKTYLGTKRFRQRVKQLCEQRKECAVCGKPPKHVVILTFDKPTLRGKRPQGLDVICRDCHFQFFLDKSGNNRPMRAARREYAQRRGLPMITLAESYKPTKPLRYGERNAVLKLLGFKSYSSYLASDLWKGIREQVLADQKCCQVCGSTSYLCVHHRKYTKDILEGSSLKGLTVLCSKHHRLIEHDDDGQKIKSPAAVDKRLQFFLKWHKPAAQFSR